MIDRNLDNEEVLWTKLIDTAKLLKSLSAPMVDQLRAIRFTVLLLFSCSMVNQVSASEWSVDSDFNPDVSDRIFALKVQNDGKILIGGNFLSVNSISQGRLSRVNQDGTQDSSFNFGTGANFSVNALIQQPDNKLVIGGGFSNFSGRSDQRITRLNLDGSEDLTFTPGSNPTIGGSVFSMLQFDTGQIILGGTISKYNTVNLRNMVRLTPTGGYNLPMANANNRVSTMAFQSDSKIIIGGSFSIVNGNARRLARLSTAGALDTSFIANTDGPVSSIMVQGDDKVILAGQFTQVNSVARSGIARVDADGNLDVNFTTSVNGIIYSMVQQESGEILIGGDFTEVNGVTQNRIARLNADGSLDASFSISANNTVRVIAIEASGDLIIGGNFTEIDGSAHNRLARIEQPKEDDLCVPIKTSSGMVALICI